MTWFVRLKTVIIRGTQSSTGRHRLSSNWTARIKGNIDMLSLYFLLLL